MISRRHISGFALISALFLMVVLSSLGAFLINTVAVQHATPALKVQSVRALYAARSGMAWIVSRVRANGTCPVATTFQLTEGALAGYQVNLNCVQTDHQVNNVGLRPYFVISVSAQMGTFGSSDFVARSLQAKISGL